MISRHARSLPPSFVDFSNNCTFVNPSCVCDALFLRLTRFRLVAFYFRLVLRVFNTSTYLSLFMSTKLYLLARVSRMPN